MLDKLCKLLDSNDVRYQKITHSKTETAEDTAHSALVNEEEFAKVVVFKVGGKMAMAVLPADEKVDPEMLATACDVKHVEIADEDEFKNLFPNCDVGAMPPFGSLFNIEVYIEEEMTLRDNIIFNAGSHTEIVKMKMSDYLAVANPEVVRLSDVYKQS